MVCSDFVVIRKLYIQENKEIFMNIFTGFIPPFIVNPPHTLNTQWLKVNCLEWKYKKVLALRKFQGNISTQKTKTFWSHWNSR